MKRILTVIALCLIVSAAGADMVAGFGDITAGLDGDGNLAMNSLTYGGMTYSADQLILGTTQRFYIDPDTGAETVWVDGESYPLGGATVGGTSTPKVTDIGAKADNIYWIFEGANDMSSIDGINFQETVFDAPTNKIFVFERGGNDAGTLQAINMDGTLGDEVSLVKYASYTNTNVGVAGQNAFGYLFTTDDMVKGLRITASGHDALTVCTVPEPATLSLLALGGLLGLRRRK